MKCQNCKCRKIWKYDAPGYTPKEILIRECSRCEQVWRRVPMANGVIRIDLIKKGKHIEKTKEMTMTDTRFPNLCGASKDKCDASIVKELGLAGIPSEECPRSPAEVPFSFIGRLGEFTFERKWHGWLVIGQLSTEVIFQLCSHESFRMDATLCKNKLPCGRPAVFHILSQDALNLFAKTMRNG